MNEIKVAEKLEFQLHEKIANKTLVSFIYVFLYLTIVFFTPILKNDPWPVVIFGSFLTICCVTRAVLVKLLKPTMSWFKLWQKLFCSAILLSSATWGVFCYWIIAKFGSDITTFIVLFPTAGIIGASVISLAPVKWLLQTYLIMIIGPIVVASFASLDQGANAYAVLSLIYLGFILTQAKHASQLVVSELEQTLTVSRQKEELEIAWKTTNDAMKVKSDFLAMMSHEIRTPLNGIIGMSNLMLEEDLSDKVKEKARTVRDCGEILLTIVNDVLDFSKIESGKMHLDMRSFQLNECVNGAIQLFISAAQKKNIQLNFYIDQSCPPAFIGDTDKIRQVLLNLIGNAIKFTERGEVSVKVRAIQKQINFYDLEFIIQDSGIGIDPAIQNQLFQPFTQGDASTTRKYGGTGLGLTICKKLVELMNGQIRFVSKLDEGSTFLFTVQVKAAQTALNLVVNHSGSETQQNHKVSRILLVEDNVINQVITEAMIEKSGYKCDIVKNGHECLNALKNREYCLILMDCQMPGMDGYETTKMIRKTPQFSHLPVIAMTANALQGDREKCIQAGMNDYITKPLKEVALIDVIKKNISVPKGKIANAK